MRILYLNPCGQMGGAETALLELMRGIGVAAPDWELHLVLGEDGPLAEKARGLGVSVRVAAFPPALARSGDSVSPLGALATAWETARYARRLDKIVAALQPDLIHTNGFKMHVLGAWIRPRGTPLAWHIHDYVGLRRWMGRALRCFRGRAAAAIVNSRSVQDDFRRVLPEIQSTVLYNAIDLSRFSPAGPALDLDAASGLPAAPSGTVRVGLVGTFAHWKGHKVFLQALSQVPGDTSVRGYIIGGPIYQTGGSQWTRNQLENEAGQLGLAGRIGFTGFQDDTAAAMRALDIVVHASTRPEPFGMVIIEAMACQRAVVAAAAGGAAEIITDGENALAHVPGDAVGLRKQILKLAGDAPLRERLGRAGRITSEQRYSTERLAQDALAFYREVLARRKPLGDSTRPVDHRSPVTPVGPAQ